MVGVEEKGLISEGTGRCSTLSIATWVKKNSKWHFNATLSCS